MILEPELAALRAAIPQAAKTNPSISQKSVGWQIDHSLRVINSICKMLEESDPSQYKWRFNFVRFYIFLRGSIPRGKGRAPKGVISDEEINPDDLTFYLDKAEKRLEQLQKLHPNSHFKHPYFGDLNLKKSIAFMGLHTRHHLKIIRELIELGNAGMSAPPKASNQA